MGFPGNFSQYTVPKGSSSLIAEISYINSSGKKRQKFDRKVLKNLIQAKILKDTDKITVMKELYIKYAYVVYDYNRMEGTEILLGIFRDLQL